MFDITLLGNGGMMPNPGRYLTSMYGQYNGVGIMIDCGEGNQIALKEKGLSCNNLDYILITHFHGDHVLGLTGMLLLMGNWGKTTPVTIVGPKGISDVVKGLCIVAPILPFEVRCIELTQKEEQFQLGDFFVTAFKVNHAITCYGYTIEIHRLPKFNLEKALKLNLDKKYWKFLQKGETVEVDGVIYTPDMVMGEPRKGIKVTYCTDTRPVKAIEDNAKGSDLFICEGMYGDDSMLDKAKEKKHMTFNEAAKIAKAADVKELWLTHYSPSLKNPKEYEENVQKIFKNTKAYLNGANINLCFQD